MRLAKKFAVPPVLALLYEFLNSLDMRHYLEQGMAHSKSDELATVPQLEDWMRERELLEPRAKISGKDHQRILTLRDAMRSFLQLAPENRAANATAAARLGECSINFPLVLTVSRDGQVILRPAPGSSQIGQVLAELQGLAELQWLDRLKVCASDECQWIFYDRSKPSNRRWCSSTLCGNRDKTRSYRRRRREAEGWQARPGKK